MTLSLTLKRVRKGLRTDVNTGSKSGGGGGGDDTGGGCGASDPQTISFGTRSVVLSK